MDIIQATQGYEDWLSKRIPLIQEDLTTKHKAMREGAFPFLRATFYRWMQVWDESCRELNNAISILSVGDIHIENFGTWRDVEGRLAWGVNDFDEAFVLPYTQDLVRLATSAMIASQESLLSIHPKDVCAAVLDGYQKGLEKGGRPFVLAEDHNHLRLLAQSETRAPAVFWSKLDPLPHVDTTPVEVVRLLDGAFPRPGQSLTIVHRVAGLGSLGRPRYTAVTELEGAKAAREAKRLTSSACAWARGEPDGEILYQKIIDGAIHAADPFIQQHGAWVVRRIAPDCSRIELSDLPHERDEARLLSAMGEEIANVHLGSSAALGAQILIDMKKRSPDWLEKASEMMVKAVQDDWEFWKKNSARG